MIAVADSGPLHYLILLGEADLLTRLYGEVVVPDAVVSELIAPAAPAAVRTWFSRPPSWLRVTTVSDRDIRSVTEALDAGERAAIALAEKLGADLLLIDDASGRAEARLRHIRVTGTLGVLRAAAEMELVDVRQVVDRLKQTNFYIDEAVLESVFERWLT
jgi:predicted nucleic acid-binding protein